jgi:hypothetical protein
MDSARSPLPAVSICLVMVAGLLFWFAPLADARADDAPGDDRPRASSKQGDGTIFTDPDNIERMVDFLLGVYDRHRQRGDWMARSMAVLSYARLDHPKAVERLMDVMENDRTPIVQVYAWEALHARQTSLAPEQREAWKAKAFELAKINGLRGEMRLGLMGLIAENGPSEEGRRLLGVVFENTNSRDPGDIRVLHTLGDIIRQWDDPDMIRILIEQMSDLDDAYRAELVLQRIHHGIPVSYQAPALKTKGEPWYRKLNQEGSEVMWSVTQRRWAEWLESETFDPAEPGAGPRYKGTSRIIPAPRKITDTRDRTWRNDAELPSFKLRQLDVVFAVDSTASMGSVVAWIKRDVSRMLRAFELISAEPRIGVTFYRDRGDAYVTQSARLTGNARRLLKQIDDADARGGGDIPEAVADALKAVYGGEKWSKGDLSKRVVLLIGDAPPHEKTVDQAVEMARLARQKRGILLHCIKVPTRYGRWKRRENWDDGLESFDRLAAAGDGNSLWVNFHEDAGRWRGQGTARAREGDSSDRKVFKTILISLMDAGDQYAGRIDSFVNVLMEYAYNDVDERRRGFPPARRHRRGRRRDPQQQR